jgi:deoxyribonuclease V
MAVDWKTQLAELQNEMKGRLNHTPPTTPIRYVAGCDLTVKDDIMVGCFVVVDLDNDCESVYEKCTVVDVVIPYIPGLLCFREGPVVLECYREFTAARPDLPLGVILVDGCGEWHPRAFGLGCYVGLDCGVPTIGVSKTFLNTGSRHTGRQVQLDAQDACPNIGDVMLLRHVLSDGEEIACAVMRTTDSDPFQPIYVSAGHMMDTDTAIDIVRRVCKFREPEPLRLADRHSRTFVKGLKRARDKSKR